MKHNTSNGLTMRCSERAWLSQPLLGICSFF